jgi:hypothetical protein
LLTSVVEAEWRRSASDNLVAVSESLTHSITHSLFALHFSTKPLMLS